MDDIQYLETETRKKKKLSLTLELPENKRFSSFCTTNSHQKHHGFVAHRKFCRAPVFATATKLCAVVAHARATATKPCKTHMTTLRKGKKKRSLNE